LFGPGVKATVAEPLLNALEVPTSVAVTEVGALGFNTAAKPKPLTPICLPPIIGI